MISPNRECSAFPIKIKIDKADVGLENVDNTSDLDKPISNAVRDYLDGAKDSVSTNVALAKEYSENAKTSETNCETIEAKIDALNVATVDTAQNITGAKTFAGETTITGPLGVSGDTALAGKVTVEKELNLDSNGSATFNGILNAINTSNALKVADHDSVLTGNDVLSAKDIMTANGDANNLLHRTGPLEPIAKSFEIVGSNLGVILQNPAIDRATKPKSSLTAGTIAFRDKSSSNNMVALYVVQSVDGSIVVYLGGFSNKNTWKSVKLLTIPWED